MDDLAKLEPMTTAPKNRQHILAKTLPRSDQWEHYGGRWFVVFCVDDGDDWALFPGFGVGSRWFEGWMPLPPAASELAELREKVARLEGALSRRGFMMTEPHNPGGNYPRSRKLVIGFENGDDADDAIGAINDFLRTAIATALRARAENPDG